MKFKGDIIQSPSGGANIVFTDIETLNVKPHEFPALKHTRKRPSEEPVIEDRQSIQDRVIYQYFVSLDFFILNFNFFNSAPLPLNATVVRVKPSSKFV